MRNSSAPKRMRREKVETSSQINSRGASSYTTRIGTFRDNPVVSSDDILFMFDDHTPEKGKTRAVVARRQQKLDSGNRLKNHATSDKDAFSVSVVTEQDPETSQLNYNENSSDGDTGTDSGDSESTESKEKKQKIIPKQKGKRKPLIPKASVSARNAPSKILSQQKQQSRMITRGNNDPGTDFDQLTVSTENETKSKGRKKEDHTSGIKTSSRTKARGLSSHKSQKDKSSTSHLSQDERGEISTQKCQKEEVVLGRSTRLKVTIHDAVHFVSDQQDPKVVQQQDDQALSKVGLGRQNAAPRKRGREGEASKTGIKNSSLTNDTAREKTHLRDDTEKDAQKLEVENLNKVRLIRVKSRANDQHDPSIPAQQDQHVGPQKGKLTLGACKVREHDQISKRELHKPLLEPRITRAMSKLAQDKENKTASIELKGETSSLIKGASNTLSQDSQLEHTLGDSGGILHFPKTVSDYADITDELLLDSSLFSFCNLSDMDGEKSTEKGQIMDGEPIIIESEYNIYC